MSKARFKVRGRLDAGGRERDGTVVIDRISGIFSVRPKHRRKVYELPLNVVATIVCERIVKLELREKQLAKIARRKARRGR